MKLSQKYIYICLLFTFGQRTSSEHHLVVLRSLATIDAFFSDVFSASHPCIAFYNKYKTYLVSEKTKITIMTNKQCGMGLAKTHISLPVIRVSVFHVCLTGSQGIGLSSRPINEDPSDCTKLSVHADLSLYWQYCIHHH